MRILSMFVFCNGVCGKKKPRLSLIDSVDANKYEDAGRKTDKSVT